MEQIESIDFKAVTAEVVSELSNIPLEKRTGGWHRSHVTKIQTSPDIIRSILLFAVWKKGLGLINEEDGENKLLGVEKAISLLMQKGAAKDKIKFKDNSFRFQLDNSQYRIWKLSDTSVSGGPWPSEYRCKIPVSGEPLADFIIRFDNEIPDIIRHVPAVVAAIRARELEEMKRLMDKQLKDRLVETLVNQYLKPLGLSARFFVNAGDIVSLDLRKVLTTHIDIPLDQLADRLKDTSSILDSLEMETPEEVEIKDDACPIIIPKSPVRIY